MDERGYIAQALFDRLAAEGLEFRVLGDESAYPEQPPAEIEVAVPREALAGVPRMVARICRELDLQLVQLAPDTRAWRFGLAWCDEVGRPRFIGLRICSDYCRGMRRYLRAEELLAGAPDALFAQGLVAAIEGGWPEDTAWLSALWQEDPRGAAERITRFWPQSNFVRLVAQAAKHGEWTPVHASRAALRRALRRTVLPRPGEIMAHLAVRARALLEPMQASVAFIGRESSLRGVAEHVAKDLAPLRLTLFEAGAHSPRADLRVAPEGERSFAARVVAAEREILRWLECRVERRYPEALVGVNPPAARLLQLACRHRLPLVQFFMNCDIRCRLPSPVLMPYPFGIVIEERVSLGSRVTVMQHASLMGEVVVEDNVMIGPGARIMGPVRIGRGATIGPNAVVTRDVSSHDTIVVEKRREDRRNVVNM